MTNLFFFNYLQKFWLNVFILCCLLTPLASAQKMIFAYHRLTTKNLEQMDQFLRLKIKISQQNQANQTEHLIGALLTLMSRPNFDNMIEKLLPLLMTELNNTELTHTVIDAFIDECLNGIRDPNNSIPGQAQVTYAIALENFLIEFKSYLHQAQYHKHYEKIANSNVRISKLAELSSKTHIPYTLIEPVALAKKILREWNEKNKHSSSKNSKKSK